MAKYTITLSELVKLGYNIFDDSWNTFDPEHKKELCEKIIRHYWFYEIGGETADRFKHYINEQLAMIMPYYNQLYASELIKIEPVYDRYIEETTGVSRDKNRNRGMAQRLDLNRLKNMADSIKKIGSGSSDLSGNQNITGHENWKEDRTIHTTEITDQDTTEHTTKDVGFTEKEVTSSNETMTNNINGTKDSDGTTKTDSTVTTDGTIDRNGTSNTTTSNTRRYSDTPQARISESGMTIEESFLTNYTRDNGSSNTSTTEHETNHQDQVTDSTQTTKINETFNSDETRTTDFTSTKDTTSSEDTTQDVKGTNDINKTIDTTDGVIGSRDKTQGTTTKEDVLTTSKEDTFSSGSETEKQGQTGYTNEDVKEREAEETKRITKAFTVSQAELLEAYRGTFINVDQMIIKDLAINFMGIF